MVIKIDTNSKEFKEEHAKTVAFTQKVCKQFGFVYNPEDEINESVTMGLTRNKMIYNKRYCPCFMVEGESEEERKSANNRICPCKPAMEVEIPNDGHCHCGIFCTLEYAKNHAAENEAVLISHTHSRGLTKEECQALLGAQSIDSDELVSLLEARELGMVDFILVDVREWMEYKDKRIKGTDFLVPTTSFYQALSQIDDKKEHNIVVYCFSGSRSAYCQQMMSSMGYKHVTNLGYGIVSYNGEVEQG
ncbi:MAG: ferredoxin-thioredoxin reductase catalytic domain-containing protein [Sulfurovaceae bacterium]|nr:ferredoxin-thioredoxin reductase catalytic domain-containing protein [Sulfurovaceae bacterium]